MNNSGFNPKVVFPYGYAIQTKSNALQTPFYFGASAIPSDLAYTRPRGDYESTKMRGRGLTTQELYEDLLEPSPSNAVLLLANNSKPIRRLSDRQITADEPISRESATILGQGFYPTDREKTKFGKKQIHRVY